MHRFKSRTIIISYLLCVLLYACQEKRPTRLVELASPNSDWLRFLDVKPSFLQDSAISPDWTWQFLTGTDSGWSDTQVPNFSTSEQIGVPHRVFAPNTSFWYRHQIIDSLINDPIFYINADDGAQFFLNGQRVPAQYGFYYQPGSLKKGDEIILKIFNNAGSGGIRALNSLEKDLWHQLISEYDKQLDSSKLALKVLQYMPDLIDSSMDRLSLLSNTAVMPLIANDSLPYFLVFPFVTGLDSSGFRVTWECPTVKESFIELKLQDRSSKILAATSRGSFFDVSFSERFWRDSVLEYRVILDGTHASEFVKLPEIDSSDFLRIAAWSDSQGGWSTFSSICKTMKYYEVDMHIGLGDLVSNGSLPWQWWSFFTAGSEFFARTPSLFVAGNHDYDGYYEDGKAVLLSQYILYGQYYPIRFKRTKNVAFLIIDQNTDFPIGVWHNQKNRLKIEEIIGSSAWKEAQWKVLLVHQPTFGEGDGGYDGEPASRDVVRGIRAMGEQVDLVLSGHNHVYERKFISSDEYGEYLQLTVGGAGRVNENKPNPHYTFVDTLVQKHHFSLVNFEENGIAVRVLSPDSTPIDSFYYPKNKKL